MAFFTMPAYFQAATAATAGSNLVCNDVLRTALGVLRGLPPLSLSQAAKIPNVGLSSLDQVTNFLTQCSKESETKDAEGSRLCLELLLCLAVQRGSLSHLLQWTSTALLVIGEAANKPRISKHTVQLALDQIQMVTGLANNDDSPHLARFKLAAALEEECVDLYEGMQCILSEVRTTRLRTRSHVLI